LVKRETTTLGSVGGDDGGHCAGYIYLYILSLYTPARGLTEIGLALGGGSNPR